MILLCINLLTFLKVFAREHDKAGVGCGGHNLDRIGVLVDALALTEHFHGQNLTDLEQHIACDLFFDPVVVCVVGPEVSALVFDFSFNS